MSLITEEELKKQLSAGRLAFAYLLCGEDGYLKKLYYDRIAEKAVDGDPFFNLTDFPADCNLQQLYDAVEQYPVMSERKCVRLTDFDVEKAASADFDRLCTILSSPNESCVLLLRFDNISFDASGKKGGRTKKLLAALDKGGGMAVDFSHRKPGELARVLCDGAAKRGCKMEAQTAKYIIDTVGNDLNLLRSELEKLTSYCKGREISRSEVDEVCIKTVEASIYDLAGYIFSCDAEKAMRLLDELFYMRVEPMVILYTVSGAYTDLYRAFTARQDGVPLSRAANAFDYGRRAFLLERAAKQLRRFDAKRLSRSFDALLSADRSFKSAGADGRIIMEKLVIELCGIASGGMA